MALAEQRIGDSLAACLSKGRGLVDICGRRQQLGDATGAAARDVAVGISKMWTTGGKEGKLQTAMAFITLIPLIGKGIEVAWGAAGKEATKEVALQGAKKSLMETAAGQEKTANIPAGRIATTDEIAHVVAFLASDDAGYITGQTINVNGGMYFGS